jgi:signal transduction histidine kinase
MEPSEKITRLEAALIAETAARTCAEKALQKSEFFLKRSQEIGAIGCFVLDIPGDDPAAQTWESTPEMDRIFGIDADYPRTGESWLGLIVQREEVLEYFSHQVFKAQSLFEKEYQIVRPSDGEFRWIFGRGELEFDDKGNCIRMVGTVQDITKRKADEEEKEKLRELLLQAQKMESIGTLAGGVAHDFNNLLTAILGTTELAMMTLDSENPLFPRFSVIQEAAQNAAELTRQLLAFSRKQVITPQVLNLNGTVNSMRKMLGRLIPENITLRTVTQPELHPVKVDPTQIQQLIINLATNARDAMPDGGILTIETTNVFLDDLYCRQHSIPDAGAYVALSITDTGSGIDEETQAHIFEPFFTTKGLGHGTGLGLATVYGAVKQNGGAIDVYSKLGTGTCFKMFFPMHPEAPSAAAPQAETAEVPRGSETILLVEDNPLALDFSIKALNMLGYRVLSASSGEEAARLSEEFSGDIQLLMTDVILPGMDGSTLAKTLKKNRPGIKVLYNSGYTENAIVSQGVLHDGLNFIAKPFSTFALAHKLRKILGKT